MEVVPYRDGDLEALRLAAFDLELIVIPALGAKISSIRFAGAEILARNPRKPLRAARYAAPYSEFDASGFDECLPTIGPCPYPEGPWQGVEVPDHGEVWSIPWAAHSQDGRLQLSTHGVRFPYLFQKSIALSGPGRVRLRYSLTNHAPLPFRYLWSSHPLVAPKPGMRIHLPPGTGVWADWSKYGRLGAPGTPHAWPHTVERGGNPVDLSLILPEAVALADKLYTTRLTEGWCAVHDPASQQYVALLFSPDEIPYVGLSINQGGWPENEPGYYNLGLEPCRGFPDRLDLAVERGVCSTLGPGETNEWSLDIHLGSAPDLPAEIERLRRAFGPPAPARAEAAE